MKILALAGAICIATMAAHSTRPDTPVAPVDDALITGDTLPKKFSDFGFFTNVLEEERNERVFHYSLNSQLFSDYAVKRRYVYVPEGKMLKVKRDGDYLIEFPVGSALIKSFGYEQDGKLRLLETRVLLHRADGWVALPYVWNDEQTEAVLKVAGTRIPVTFTDPSGETRTISYSVPNKNQCKECHSLKDAVMPIGPKMRNLDYISTISFDGLELVTPEDLAPGPSMPDYEDESGAVGDRARAYLDINCAHCHNRQGSASNSGLFLAYEEPVGVNLGIGKRPTAAGRGSGGLEFAIAPGKPDESIMIYRLKSLDPGIAMPEVGRSTVHKEGVELLSEWISELD